MKKAILALAGLAVAAAAVPAGAIDLRHANQERRIDAGERSGKLTAREAAYLKAREREIAAMRAHMKARHGGHLTAANKRLLKMKQDQANAEILRMKHNRYHGKNHLKL